MQAPELRLVRYWVAVAEEGNITRAAERLHVSQPALSSAVKQLEAQLGVALLDRSDRVLRVTPAGELLLSEGRALLREADRVFDAVRARDRSVVGRLRIGMTPTARYGLGPSLLAACAERAAGVMLYPQEDASGALLRDVRSGRLDLAVVFCAPPVVDGVVLEPLLMEPAVVHLRSDHPLASRSSVALEELSGETFLVAESAESGGFTARVLELCRARGFEPVTRPDPYPDLGLQAVREGLAVVVYVRGAFPADVPGSSFVPVSPAVGFPFSVAWRDAPRSGALDAVLAAIRVAVADVDPEY
jgi:DNA-binding transcriptional LysR family regulator